MNEASRLAFASNAALYTPIRSGQTRVLAIKPSAFGQPIVTTLHIVNLDRETGACIQADQQLISYKALSYCWGEQKFDCTITCNAHVVRITASLHDALQRIRERHGQCYLWVDGICINQADLQERGSQVAAMIEIYPRAEEVIVWLGENGTQLSLRDALSIQSTPQNEESAKRLARNPWFYRVWVRQEVWAARKSFILYGSESCGWDELALFPSIRDKVGKERQVVDRLCRSFKHRARDVRLPRNEEQGIVDLLFQARSSQCTDPRDFVYGLLGMINIKTHGVDLSCSHDNCMVVDYTRSPSQVYQDLAVYVMKASHSLSVLYLEAAFGRTDDMQDLPSWTPDWRTCERPDEAIHVEQQRYPNSCHVPADGTLEVRGLQIGIVGEIFYDSRAKLKWPLTENIARCVQSIPDGFIPVDLDDFREMGTQSLRPLIDSGRVGDRKYVFYAGINQQLSRDVSAARIFQETGAVEVVLMDLSGKSDDNFSLRITVDDVSFQAKYDYTERDPDNWDDSVKPEDTGLDVRYARLDKTPINDILERIWDEFQSWGQSETFFDYQSAARKLSSQVWAMPPNVRDGDMVLIARGGAHPLVLRPKGTCFELIGKITALQGNPWGNDTYRESDAEELQQSDTSQKRHLTPEEREKRRQQWASPRSKDDRAPVLLRDVIRFNEQSSVDYLQTYHLV